MTLIGISLRQEHVEVLTDTAACLRGFSGRLFHCDKIAVLPHRDAAILTAGGHYFGSKVRVALEDLASLVSFEQILPLAPETLRELYADHLSQGHAERPQRVFLIGLSETADSFVGFTYDAEEDFNPRPLEPVHLQPMPNSHRPCPADVAAFLREAETDGLGEQDLAAEIAADWSELPPFPRPKDAFEWGRTALYVREHCALQEFNKTMVAGSAYLTRIERGSVTTVHLLDFNDTGDELRRLVRGTQHPVAQLDVCPDCDSGKAYLDCHLADQIDQPCGCGSGEPFRRCCMVSSVEL